MPLCPEHLQNCWNLEEWLLAWSNIYRKRLDIFLDQKDVTRNKSQNSKKEEWGEGLHLRKYLDGLMKKQNKWRWRRGATMTIPYKMQHNKDAKMQHKNMIMMYESWIWQWHNKMIMASNIVYNYGWQISCITSGLLQLAKKLSHNIVKLIMPLDLMCLCEFETLFLRENLRHIF